ncbi:MAG: hypothetical protein AAF902_16600 [Chloroflexota bacterium]
MTEGNDILDWRIELRRALEEYFNEIELQALCYDLRIDFDEVKRESKSATVIEIIERTWRHSMIDKLITLCQQQRPNVPWNNIADGAKQESIQMRPIGRPTRERRSNPPPIQGGNNYPSQPTQIRASIVPWIVSGIVLFLAISYFVYERFIDVESPVTPIVQIPSPIPTRPEDVLDRAGTLEASGSDSTPKQTATSTFTPVPPTITPTQTPTPTPVEGFPVAKPQNSIDASAWFTELTTLNGGPIREVKNEDLYAQKPETLAYMNSIGRLTSYERTYRHSPLCQSTSGVEAVYIQAFFFRDTTGARQFMTWATNSWTFNGVVPRSDLGEQSYYFKRATTTLDGGDCLLEADSYTTQKGNVVYRTVVYTLDGDLRWSDTNSLNEAINIARWAVNQVP